MEIIWATGKKIGPLPILQGAYVGNGVGLFRGEYESPSAADATVQYLGNPLCQ